VTAAKKPALIDRRGPSSGLSEEALVRELARIALMDPEVKAAFIAATGLCPGAPMELGPYVDWLTAEWIAFRDADARVARAISLMQRALLTDDSERCRELYGQRNALESTFSPYEWELYKLRLRTARLKTETETGPEIEAEAETETASSDGSGSIH